MKSLEVYILKISRLSDDDVSWWRYANWTVKILNLRRLAIWQPASTAALTYQLHLYTNTHRSKALQPKIITNNCFVFVPSIDVKVFKDLNSGGQRETSS